MVEPVTTGALVIGGLTWVGLAALGNAIGNPTDRAVCRVLRNMKERVAGLKSMPENHDVSRAVRIAQVQALERLIRDYREIGRPEWQTEQHTRPNIFFQRSLTFCEWTIGRCSDPKVKLDLEVTEPLIYAIDGILAGPVYDGPADRRADAIAFFSEQAVLDELQEVLGPVVLPEGFEAHFRNGAAGRPRFLDLFGRYVAEQIKGNSRFHAILTTGQLARIEGLTFDTTEILARFGQILDRVAEDTSATREAITRIEAGPGLRRIADEVEAAARELMSSLERLSLKVMSGTQNDQEGLGIQKGINDVAWSVRSKIKELISNPTIEKELQEAATTVYRTIADIINNRTGSLRILEQVISDFRRAKDYIR